MAISLALATRFPQRLTPRPGGLMHVIWRVAAVIALVVFLSGLFLQHNPLWSSMRLMVFITLYVTFNSRTARDDRMVVVVSLLHVVLAAALTTEITFAPFLLAWLLSAFHAQLAGGGDAACDSGGWRPMRIEPVARGPRYGRTAAELVAAVTVVGARGLHADAAPGHRHVQPGPRCGTGERLLRSHPPRRHRADQAGQQPRDGGRAAVSGSRRFRPEVAGHGDAGVRWTVMAFRPGPAPVPAATGPTVRLGLACLFRFGPGTAGAPCAQLGRRAVRRREPRDRGLRGTSATWPWTRPARCVVRPTAGVR